MEEDIGAKFLRLHNYLQSRKVVPVVQYEAPVSITGSKGGITILRAKCSVGGIEFKSEGRNKMECKVSIYQDIQDAILAGDSGGGERSLELPPPQSLPPKRRRGSRGGPAQVRQVARFKEKIKMFKDFVSKNCVCGRMNF